jgi:hypothetical protein
MATGEQELRAQLSEERRRLQQDVAELRRGLPLVAAAVVVLGFVAAGGVRATARLLFRRGRER